MSIIACGPYIGDFQQEILTFRPFVRYISSVTNEQVFISSHSNRRFMYDWVDDEHFLPVNHSLTRLEEKQKGYIHTDISQKDYNLLIKVFKNHISKFSQTQKKEIDFYNIPYTRFIQPHSIYQKIFTQIDVPHLNIVEKKFIVFIPDINSIQLTNAEKLYHKLTEKYNVIVIGDMKTHLDEYNIFIKNNILNYFDIGYQYILNYMKEAICVVTPCSHWTTICNLQKIPVFSWGEYVSAWKPGGIYNFENKNIMSVYMGKKIDYNVLLSSLDYFLKEKLK